MDRSSLRHLHAGLVNFMPEHNRLTKAQIDALSRFRTWPEGGVRLEAFHLNVIRALKRKGYVRFESVEPWPLEPEWIVKLTLAGLQAVRRMER